MIEDFLAKLGANTKITVGVSISPSIGLEMIEIDRATGIVNKYAHKPLEYNYSAREITNYDQFAMSLEELFEELHISKKSNIILNFPNVHFGIISLPLLLTDEAITNAIISEVEQSYIFKRHEPAVSWVEVGSNIDTENRTLAYSAIQKKALEEITAACESIGCTLVGVETSYSTLLRALYYTDLAKEQMKENITWNLMVIGQNSYSIISMIGKKIIDYYEEPLALKSFVDDEIYNAITTSAQLTLSGLPANHLYIVSETNLVSSEVLSMKMPFEGKKSFLECNKYIQNEIIPANLEILPNVALEITPEAIGAATAPFSDFPLKLNLLANSDLMSSAFLDGGGIPRVNIGNLEIELTPDFVKKVSLIIGGAVVIPMIILSFLLVTLEKREKTRLDSVTAQVATINAEIAKYNKAQGSDAFDLGTSISNIIANNKDKLSYYSALGVSIPNKLWVTYYMENGKGGIDIKGKATNVESVYTFYKNIKQMVNNSNIKLYKLEISSGSIDQMVSDVSSEPNSYQFEITNMTPEELNPQAAKPEGTTPAAAPTGPTNEPQKPLFQIGKPLFGTGNTPPAGGATTQGAPTPPAPAPTGQEQLPSNLQKIEKF